MKHVINYKVPDGKLLRLLIDRDGDVIRDIRITGDFFVHPETGIQEIETLMKGKAVDDACEAVEKLLDEGKIRVIGFRAQDVRTALGAYIV